MEILIICSLIFLNGVFAMAEMATVSARKVRLETAAKKGDKRARQAFELANRPGKLLSTVQVGITVIGLFMGLYSGEAIVEDVQVYLNRYASLQPYSEEISITVVLVSITFFSLIFGELVPKRIALAAPERIAKMLAFPMYWISLATAPFVWLLMHTTELFMKILPAKKAEDTITEEEIKAFIQEGTDAGTVQEIEQDIVERVFHLGDRKVNSLMTHRRHVLWLDKGEHFDHWKEKISGNPYTVYPVCEGSPDRILGIIHIKDILDDLLQNREPDLMKYIRTPLYFPQSTKAYRALEKFKNEKKHFAIVVDEYGGMEGVITRSDLLETLVENVSEDLIEEKEIVVREDGSFLVNADIFFPDLLTFLSISVEQTDETDGVNSLAGFILHHGKHIPSAGYKFTWEGYVFEVIDMDGRRIDKVLIAKVPA